MLKYFSCRQEKKNSFWKMRGVKMKTIDMKFHMYSLQAILMNCSIQRSSLKPGFSSGSQQAICGSWHPLIWPVEDWRNYNILYMQFSECKLEHLDVTFAPKHVNWWFSHGRRKSLVTSLCFKCISSNSRAFGMPNFLLYW